MPLSIDLVLILPLVIYLNGPMFRPVRMFTRTRAEAPPFWKRRRDEIWIAIVAAA